MTGKLGTAASLVGKARDCLELQTCHSLGSLNGPGARPYRAPGRGVGQKKQCWPVSWRGPHAGVCVGATNSRSLWRGSRLLETEAGETQAACPASGAHPSGDHLRCRKAVRASSRILSRLTLLCFLCCCISFQFLRRLFLKILVRLF